MKKRDDLAVFIATVTALFCGVSLAYVFLFWMHIVLTAKFTN